jgi:hypothetical protein
LGLCNVDLQTNFEKQIYWFTILKKNHELEST